MFDDVYQYKNAGEGIEKYGRKWYCNTLTAFAPVSPTVEYNLTPKGRKLEPIINEFYQWGLEYFN